MTEYALARGGSLPAGRETPERPALVWRRKVVTDAYALR